MTPTEVRNKLRGIGRRRERLRRAEESLHADTITALKLAKGKVPTTEAATLVGLNRSTVYEVYGKGKNGRLRPKKK